MASRPYSVSRSRSKEALRLAVNTHDEEAKLRRINQALEAGKYDRSVLGKEGEKAALEISYLQKRVAMHKNTLSCDGLEGLLIAEKILSSQNQGTDEALALGIDVDEELEAAAKKIQAVQRNRKAKRAETDVKTLEALAIAEQVLAAQDSGGVDLEFDAELEAAAVKIQAMQRGKLARKSLDSTTPSALPAAAEDAIDLDMEDPELAAAASRIQAIQRGRLSRRQASQPAPEPEEEAIDVDLGDPELQEAALKIQAIQRGRLARRAAAPVTVAEAEAGAIDLDMDDPELADAAAKIQAIHRGRATRRSMSKPTLVVEEEVLVDMNDEELIAAAARIQAVQRGRQTRRSLSKQVADMAATGESVETVDMDMDDPELKDAALKIQAIQRGRLARREYLHKVEEETGAAPEPEAIDLQMDAELEAAALKIQAIQRGKMVRRSSK
jgi:hypothetical protein